jgi:hypothetical protein
MSLRPKTRRPGPSVTWQDRDTGPGQRSSLPPRCTHPCRRRSSTTARIPAAGGRTARMPHSGGKICAPYSVATNRSTANAAVMGQRPLELDGGHRVRPARHVLRVANRDDQPGPVAVDADAGVWSAAESMPDPGADLLAAQRPSVYVVVGRLQPREVQIQTARPPVPDLHRREMTPSLMLQQGHSRLIGFAAVDLDRDVIARHPATVQPGSGRSFISRELRNSRSATRRPSGWPRVSVVTTPP